MKIVCFDHPPRIGALLDDAVVDLNLAFAALAAHEDCETRPYAKADAVLPAGLADFLTAGQPAIDAAEAVLVYIDKNPQTEGPSGERLSRPSAEVRLEAPLPSLASRIFCGGGWRGRHRPGSGRS